MSSRLEVAAELRLSVEALAERRISFALRSSRTSRPGAVTRFSSAVVILAHPSSASLNLTGCPIEIKRIMELVFGCITADVAAQR
jgi:hypothetical protein